MVAEQFQNRVEHEQLSTAERFNSHPLATLETYKFFNQVGESYQASKQTFIDAVVSGDEMDAPVMQYPRINLEDLLEHRDSLTAMLADFPNDRELDVAERITRENISNRLDEVSIMMLTKLQSEIDSSDPNYERISGQLGINMREVYGMPDATHFKGILGLRMHELHHGLASIPSTDIPDEVQSAMTYLTENLPVDLPISHPHELNPKTAEWQNEQLEKRLLPSRVAVQAMIDQGDITFDEEGKMDADAILRATKAALAARDCDGWTAELTNESNIDTTQSRKTICIPESARMTLEQFDSVMLSHEIDQHVARRVNGDASGIPELAGTGAHGYLAQEESTGGINQNLLSGDLNLKKSAYLHFLNGGLALGLDSDSNGRNMRQTCELVWRMNFVNEFIDGKHDGSVDNIRAFVEKATTALTRIFRGTDGKVPGVVFTKDSVTYYQGAADVFKKWNADMELPEEERLFQLNVERAAKHDITRADQSNFIAANLRANPYKVR